MARSAQIRFNVSLDSDNFPESISWEADDSGFDGSQESKAVFVSLWDGEKRECLGIDLWVKSMDKDEMSRFVTQIIHKLADTYKRATGYDTAASVLHTAAEAFWKEAASALEDGK